MMSEISNNPTDLMDTIGKAVNHVRAQVAECDWDGWMGYEVAENVLNRIERALEEHLRELETWSDRTIQAE